MNKYALILAGGKGTRLWPISTERRPKQFLKLYGNEIMVNETIRRIESIIDYNNIFVIINEEQKELANRYIDNRIPRENIITEPKSKNTAMCIFYATLKIKKIKGDGVISVLSSDHYIEDEKKFIQNLEETIELANNNENIVTIGIKPTYPAIGFGYIKYEENINKICEVVEFKEKPNYEVAAEYVKSNKYMWNSGMFIWRTTLILKCFKKYLPNIYSFKKELYEAIDTNNEQLIIKKVYDKVENISIDKGILEKTHNIKMIKADFEWMDIGSIKDFFEIYQKDEKENVIIGNVIAKDMIKSNILNNSENLLIAVGIDNVNIIEDNGVCIVYDKEKSDILTQILEEIKKEEKYKKYL